MKYPSYKSGNTKNYRLRALLGGIDLNEDPVVIPEDKLCEGENMWIKNGMLCSRQGLAIDNPNVMEVEEYGYCSAPLTITDTIVTVDGEPCNIGYDMVFDSADSRHTVNVYFVSRQGEFAPAGSLVFNRISSDEFYFAESIYFISGKGTKGCGIYAFVKISDYGINPSYQIFELSLDRSQWLDISISDCYAPIIYINGRGTRYGESVDAYGAAPMTLEQQNLLTGRFKAFYSSDDFSSAFQLPLSGLDDDSPVICRVYRWPGEYTQWIVPEGKQEATASFYGNEITMKCDRQTGYISFAEKGVDFSLPKMPLYNGNNIVFTAYKTEKDGMARVIGSKRAFSYNSRAYVCSNSVCPNEVYSARLSNPLYFPKDSTAVVGETASGITAIAVQNNKLIAFKTNEIYRIDLNEGKRYSTKELLIGEGTDFFRADSITVSNIHTEIGCDCPDSVRLCGNRLVWLNSDGNIYALATTAYGKENNIYEISLPIKPRLGAFSVNELKNAFACEHQGKYILFVDQTAFVMDYRVKAFGFTATYLSEDDVNRALAWYCWSLPDSLNMTSAISTAKGLTLACHTENLKIHYTLCFCGDKDTVLMYNENDQLVEREYPVAYRLKTGLIGFGNEQFYKDLKFLCITASAENWVTIMLTGDGRTVKRKLKLPKNPALVKMLAHLNGFSRMSMTICGEGAVSVTEPIFYYNIRVC